MRRRTTMTVVISMALFLTILFVPVKMTSHEEHFPVPSDCPGNLICLTTMGTRTTSCYQSLSYLVTSLGSNLCYTSLS